MTEAIRELEAAELDRIAGGGFWSIIVGAAVGAICKGASEAFFGGLASGLETGGAGFVVAALGAAAGAGCAYGVIKGN